MTIPAPPDGPYDPTLPLGGTAYDPTLPAGAPAYDPTLPAGGTAYDPMLPEGTPGYEPTIPANAPPPPRPSATGPWPRADGSVGWRMPGVLRDRYEVVEVIQQSARGRREAALARARDRRTGASVIVKVYEQVASIYDQDVLRRIVDERPPHVVPLLEVGRDEDGSPYEVMAEIRGETLAAELSKGPLGAERAEQLVADVAAALTALHGSGLEVVHNDLKPANIVRDAATDEYLLIDFGLLSTPTRVSIADPRGAQVGTIMYWSPEHQNRWIQASGDWWALGLIAHEAVFGRHPYALPHREFAVISQILRGNRAPAIETRGDLRWLRLINGLLTFTPRQRWGATAVARWLAGEGRDRDARPNPQEVPAEEPMTTGPPTPQFEGVSYQDAAELASAMSAHWVAGESFVTALPNLQALARWARSAGDETLARRIDAATIEFEEIGAPPSYRLIRITQDLDPEITPLFQGEEVTVQSLGRQALEVMQRQRDGRGLERMLRERALEVLGSREGVEELARAAYQWAENVRIVRRLRDSVPVDPARRVIRENFRVLVAYGLFYALLDEGGLDTERRRHTGLDDRLALRQPWYAELEAHARGEFAEHEDPREGRVATMSALLAATLREEARLAEHVVVSSLAAEESDVPETAGGRVEDVDYRIPTSRVGRYPVIPRPPIAAYDPSWIFRPARRAPKAVAAGFLRVVAVLGASFLLLGLVRVVGGAILQVDPGLPGRLGEQAGSVVAGWASLYDAWMSVPALSSIDPLSQGGAWVPLVVGAALLVLARVGTIGLRPPVSRFRDTATPRAPRVLAAILVTVGALAAVVYLPWLVLLAPIAVLAVVIRPAYW